MADAWSDAFARLQQQVQYNTHAIEDQHRHLTDLHDAVRSLHSEIGSIWRSVDYCREQIQNRSDNAPTNRPESADIDVLTSQLLAISNKANEVDGLKVQLDLLTRRMRRMERDPNQPSDSPASAAPGSAVLPSHTPEQPAHSYHHPSHQLPHQRPTEEPRPESHSHHPPGTRHAQEHLQLPEDRTLPGFRALDTSASVRGWRPANHQAASPRQAATSAAAGQPVPARHDAPPSSGWAAVNAGTKRPVSMDGPGSLDGSASPKRQKLATLMPRAAEHHQPAQHPGTNIVQLPPPSGVHDSWHKDKVVGRGPEEDRDGASKRMAELREWAANRDSYRRQPQHAYALSPQDPYRPRELQPANFSPEGHRILPVNESSPPLGETKKSRTKPTRNADGILIRKDGRPDMRSISSAQNLRKVHAKKEAERSAEMQNGHSGLNNVTSSGSVAGDTASVGTPAPTLPDDSHSPVSVSMTASPRTPTVADDVQARATQIQSTGAEKGDLHPSSPAVKDSVMVDAVRETQEKSVEQPHPLAEAHAVAV